MDEMSQKFSNTIKKLGISKILNVLKKYSPHLRVLDFVLRNPLLVAVAGILVYYTLVIVAFIPIMIISAVIGQETEVAGVTIGQQGNRKDPVDLVGLKGVLTSGNPIKSGDKIICYEPIFKPDNDVIYKALRALKCAEFGALPNNEAIISDRDSCGPGQQRVSEFYTNKNFIKILAGMLDAGEYNTVYNESMKSLVQSNPNNPRQLYQLTSGYGKRNLSIGGFNLNNHEGIDWDFPTGTPVTSAFSGNVTFAGTDDKSGGRYVHIYNQEIKKSAVYFHLSDWSVKTGDNVKEGQMIGRSGTTGWSTAPHLHFQTSNSKSWLIDTFDPSKEGYAIYARNPFIGMCRMLQNANIKTGVLDVAMIQRLKNEYPELFNLASITDKNKFLNKLCSTQRPQEWIPRSEQCQDINGGWLDRARKAF